MENLTEHFTSLFGSRNNHLTRINEAIDYLSRLTRQNIAILNVDSQTNKLSLLTEFDDLVECNYTVDDAFVLDNFKINKLDEVLSDEYVDTCTSTQVSKFVSSLRENRYDNAEKEFDNLISAFSARSVLNELRDKVQKTKDSLNKNLFNSDGEKFKQIQEIKENIANELSEIEEFDMDVVNALKLNNAISKAYNIPRQNLEDLKVVTVPRDSRSNLYEMICENELVRKEIINSKGNLSGAWSNNPLITELASCIYEDDSTIGEKILNIVKEVPYFALASKKEIQEVLASTYAVVNPGTVSTKDIRHFTSKIFETKKPVKEVIVEMLNIKYGVNINNLKMVPSFKTLSDSQSTLFKLLSETVEKGGLSGKTMKEFSSHIRHKGGVGTLDIADFINEIFQSVEFEDEEHSTFMKTLNLNEAVSSLLSEGDEEEEKDENGKIDSKKLKEVAKKAKAIATKLKEKGEEKEGDETEEEKEGDDSSADKDKDGDGDVDNVDKKVDDEEKAIKKEKKKGKKKDEKGDEKEALKEQVAPAAPAAPEQEAEMEGETPPSDDEFPGGVETPALSDAEMVDLVSDLETLFADIDFSKSQKMTEDEEEEEGEDLEAEERDDELQGALEDLDAARDAVRQMQDESGEGAMMPEDEDEGEAPVPAALK